MAKKSSRTKVHESGEIQHDFIEHGSDEHAAWLSLKRAEKGDKPQYKGWTLDGEPYGVIGWTDDQKLAFLKQKVSSLTTLPPEVQSEDPQADFYAPTMWSPRDEDESPVSGII